VKPRSQASGPPSAARESERSRGTRGEREAARPEPGVRSLRESERREEGASARIEAEQKRWLYSCTSILDRSELRGAAAVGFWLLYVYEEGVSLSSLAVVLIRGLFIKTVHHRLLPTQIQQ
jgi:hypothetical protein